MIIKTRGIVLLTRQYGESSVIIEVLTQAKGLQSYIISGVRQSKPKVSPMLTRAMTLIDLVAYWREDKDLHRTKEIQHAYMYAQLPFDLQRSSIGTCMIECIRSVLVQPLPDDDLFEFIFSAFVILDQTSEQIYVYHIWFVSRLLDFLGLTPDGVDLPDSQLDIPTGGFVLSQNDELLIEHEVSQTIRIACQAAKHTDLPKGLSKEHRVRTFEVLIQYYQYHVDGFRPLKSVDVLTQLFN